MQASRTPLGFSASGCNTAVLALKTSFAYGKCRRVDRTAHAKSQRRRSRLTKCAAGEQDASGKYDEAQSREELDQAMRRMRSRLEGLFGGVEEDDTGIADSEFNGSALRRVIKDRWGVQYDIQPQKRHGRVYIQVMWRYFEQQSFYLGEDEFASHCEAVAQMLRQWGAVDYFCDYISSIKKRPVVGITINIPIPDVDASRSGF